MDLDDIKKSWQQTQIKDTHSSDRIFSILKKNSTSVARLLFFYTVFEFLLILIFFIYSTLLGNHLFDTETSQYISKETFRFFNIITVIAVFITLIFMLFTYRYYQRIHYNQNTTSLISSIISFRNVINYFVLFSIILTTIASTPMYYEIGKGIYYTKHLNEVLVDDNAKQFGILTVGISILFILLLASIYYLFLYFVFLKKLKKNLIELKTVD
ncbi:hypothetical protein QP547_09115 [Weeksella virosa]|mgnify:CR=1 FL=1|uniref:hypothetical protein n=1 Tax=Weeksella virosa TaxID=1014 RepID=UPI0025558A90|nr:hypothetical protein [Weeksella virosa]MDK7675959.1 hypothetical protein [Weeksella virosa]